MDIDYQILYYEQIYRGEIMQGKISILRPDSTTNLREAPLNLLLSEL